MSRQSNNVGKPGDEQAAAVSRRPAPIDIERLVEKVYQLMLADLRLERAREAWPARRKGT
jgi:hypothetical protein